MVCSLDSQSWDHGQTARESPGNLLDMKHFIKIYGNRIQQSMHSFGLSVSLSLSLSLFVCVGGG